MVDLMAFSYQDCDTCVILANRVLKKRGKMDWAELEPLLFVHQQSHQPKVHSLSLYPSMSAVPTTTRREISGFLFLEIPEPFYAVRQTILALVKLYYPLSVRLLKSYIAEQFDDCELKLELDINSNMPYARLTLQDFDLRILNKVLSVAQI
jgi:hypothetical protein